MLLAVVKSEQPAKFLLSFMSMSKLASLTSDCVQSEVSELRLRGNCRQRLFAGCELQGVNLVCSVLVTRQVS